MNNKIIKIEHEEGVIALKLESLTSAFSNPILKFGIDKQTYNIRSKSDIDKYYVRIHAEYLDEFCIYSDKARAQEVFDMLVDLIQDDSASTNNI